MTSPAGDPGPEADAGWAIVAARTRELTQGPLAGWRSFPEGWDPFRELAGPFGFRRRSDGQIEAGFWPGPPHCDGSGQVSSRALAAFVDFCAIDLSRPARAPHHAVTLSAQIAHFAPAQAGALISATAAVSGTRYWLVSGAMMQRGDLVARFQVMLALVR
jgi:hypothetical protein